MSSFLIDDDEDFVAPVTNATSVAAPKLNVNKMTAMNRDNIIGIREEWRIDPAKRETLYELAAECRRAMHALDAATRAYDADPGANRRILEAAETRHRRADADLARYVENNADAKSAPFKRAGYIKGEALVTAHLIAGCIFEIYEPWHDTLPAAGVRVSWDHWALDGFGDSMTSSADHPLITHHAHAPADLSKLYARIDKEAVKCKN